MVSRLQRALIAYKVAGTQARKLKTTEAIGLTTGRKRIVLQDVYGGLTAAGKYWTEELERDGIRLRTETHSKMWSDATTFYLTARLEAYEDDKLMYERDVEDGIKRHFM